MAATTTGILTIKSAREQNAHGERVGDGSALCGDGRRKKRRLWRTTPDTLLSLTLFLVGEHALKAVS